MVYIVSCISKSQRGMGMLLHQACKEARQGNMDLKQQVRHMGNHFLNRVGQWARSRMSGSLDLTYQVLKGM